MYSALLVRRLLSLGFVLGGLGFTGISTHAQSRVTNLAPDELPRYLTQHANVVVQFTSPDKRCGYCIGADAMFSEGVLSKGKPGWSYVRVQWPQWKETPRFPSEIAVYGVPDHQVYVNARYQGTGGGRSKDASTLMALIDKVIVGSPVSIAVSAPPPSAPAASEPADERNPHGFNTPQGYEIRRHSSQAYALVEDPDSFSCLENSKWRRCGSGDIGFTDKALPRIEGKVETVTYRVAPGNAAASDFLLQRNYERVIQEMGGRLLARMIGQDEKRGNMKQVHLLERNGEKRWILVNTWSASSAPELTVVTMTAAPTILSAGEIKVQLDRQGYATLNVNFDTNKSVLRKADLPTLAEVVKLMQQESSLRLSVDGHTDNVGDAAANKTLSQARANAIVDHLLAQGIASNRVKPQGFGLEMPIADNRTEEGRAKNRRVELVKQR